MSSNSMGARFAVRVADLRAMRRVTMSPHVAHIAAEPTIRIRRRPRQRHATHHGRVVGRTSRLVSLLRTSSQNKKNFQQVYRNNNKRVSWPHCPYVWVSGVRSTRRIAPAACWASWADALHMIQGRRPEVADAKTQRFGAHPEARRSCSLPGILLDHNGWSPRVVSIVDGSRTTSHASHRGWRVATRMAILRAFRF